MSDLFKAVLLNLISQLGGGAEGEIECNSCLIKPLRVP